MAIEGLRTDGALLVLAAHPTTDADAARLAALLRCRYDVDVATADARRSRVLLVSLDFIKRWPEEPRLWKTFSFFGKKTTLCKI